MARNHRIVGLIATMSPDKTWAPEVVERVTRTHGVVKRALERLGFEVADEGPIHREYKQMWDAGRKLRARGVNALVVYVGTWTYGNCVVAAAIEADVPVIVWGDAGDGTAGFVGGCVSYGALKEHGLDCRHVYGPFDDETTLANVRSYLSSACAAKGLRGQILGVGGNRSMGMVTAVCDPNECMEKFGIEIDGWEQADLIERARDIPDERAMKFYQWMAETFGTIVAGKEAVIAQIKMYLAMRELIEDKGYDFVAAKCLPELPAVYTTFCLAHAILGDACDAFGQKDPFVFACEADVNAALTMQILKLLAGGPVMFTDLTHYDLKDNLLILCNCGSQPTDFASSKEDVYWEKEGVHEFVWRIGGTCPQHVAKPGAVTLARMGRERGEYLMMMGTGRAIDMPREKLRETVWERPHAFVRPDCPPDRFVENVLSNHIHLVYGDHVEQLEEVCRILKIRPVIL